MTMIKAIDLKTEYLINPIGIDIPHPRLFWNVSGALRQTAYRIIAVTDGTVVWDSGKVMSNSMRTVYQPELCSRDRIEWTVTLWDENDHEGESAAAFFETGLLSPEDWKAKWIRGDYRVSKKYRYPNDHFKKTFQVNQISRARLYITACGAYELRINGSRIGDFVLAPGHTDYRKRIQYQTYDVTGSIRCGENVIEAELADGWYRGAQGAWGHTYLYGKETKLLAQLEITDAESNIQLIYSDHTWKWSGDRPRLFADLKEGEYVDAGKGPSYRGFAKEAALKANLSASNNFPVMKHETFTPKLMITQSGAKVLDFGQNLSGFIGFRVFAKQGQRIFLRMGELLDGNSEFTQDNIQLATHKDKPLNRHVSFCRNGLVKNIGQFSKGKVTPLQMLEFVCREGENRYESKFALYGFRYALVETDVSFSSSDFYSAAVYSDFEQTGFFKCSNTLINQFADCTLWSEKSNSADVPTDCPTRERSGWTGDSQIFFETASFFTSYQPFARKYMRDLFDRQSKYGKLHQIVPKGGEDFWMTTMNGSVGWADAGVLIPYRMWKKYGDDRIIKENYSAMKRYALFMIKRAGRYSLLSKPIRLSKKNRKYLVNCGQSYGEWAEPSNVQAFSIKDFIFPHPEESTAYTAFVMKHMAEIAKYLGKYDDKKLYESYAEGCEKAYRELITKAGFSLDTNRQAKLVRPLYMHLLDDETGAYAKVRLLNALEACGWRLGTGFLSTPFILDVLADIDIEYAYRLLENEECPGWLFMPKQGATTVWEAWEGSSTPSHGIASLNHYSKGAVCEWLFRSVCGIHMNSENHFVISPKPGGTLAWAEAAYRSIYGTVSVLWKRKGQSISLSVSLPPNTTADVVLPNETRFIDTPDEHIFEYNCS